MAQRQEFANCYTTLISSYGLAVDTEKQLNNKLEYTRIMQELLKQPEAKRQELKDLLPAPIQRIGRYPLLISSILIWFSSLEKNPS